MPGTTPVYGFPYPEPTDLVADYPALGQQLAEDIESVLPTIGGLAPAPPTSIANTGGTASTTGNTTTFTGTSSLSLNGVFTANHSNYIVMLTVDTLSASASVNIRLRASGTDNTGSNYIVGGWYSAMNVTGYNPTGGSTYTAWTVALTSSANTSFPMAGSVEFLQPFVAAPTRATWQGIIRQTSNTYMLTESLYHTQSTAYDGLTLYSSSNMTGNIAVYGFNE